VTKEQQRKRQWWQRQAEKPVIDNVPVMPDRLLNQDASTTEQAEFAALLPAICAELRAKRPQVSGHTNRPANIRQYHKQYRGLNRSYSEV